MKNKNEQLELTIAGNSSTSRSSHRVTRHTSSSVSSWWFARMRQLVDSARDWPTVPAPRSTFPVNLSE